MSVMSDESAAKPGDAAAPSEPSERPQRRREWNGPMRSVGLPLFAVAAIVFTVWFLQNRGIAGSAATASGTGVVALDTARNHSGKPPSPEIGRAAPDFRLQTLDGRTVRLSDLQGKMVLVNFWATWCLPCRQEMPEIVKAYAQYAQNSGNTFEVIAVDEQEDAETVQKWVHDFGMTFPVTFDATGQVGQTYRAGSQFPTSVWIDANGIVTDIKYGPMNKDYLDQKFSADW